jgi:hypothetical protein
VQQDFCIAFTCGRVVAVPIMILSDLFLPSRVNQQWATSGIDSIDQCLNKQHFLDYPHSVDYCYNSRGFRDAEWPKIIEELQNAIWCVGDSFTVGIGSPYEFTWPQVLAKESGRRCINVSMDGASNNWISRRACQIIKEIAPKHMVVLWSYFHRRELPNINLSDEVRRIHSNKSDSTYDNLMNFISCYSAVEHSASTIKLTHGIIPQAYPAVTLNVSWENIRDPVWPKNLPETYQEFDQLPAYIKQETADRISHAELKSWFVRNDFWKHNKLIELSNLDYARDHHHFDKITSEFFVKQILKNFD